MKKTFLYSLAAYLSLAMSSCDGQQEVNEAGSDTTEYNTVNDMDTAVNRLTEAQKQEGWSLLFDGQSLAQWRMYQDKPGNSWTIQDSSIYCKGSSTDKSDLRGDLITREQFEDFELEMDWKISPAGNSGLMYMVNENSKAAYMSGPEYQMIDDEGFPEKLEDWQKTGANYAMNTATKQMAKPVGQWNHTRLVVNKGHVEHWLNGEKVVEYELWSDEWKASKVKGKWKDTPEYGMTKKGHIALQDHGSEAWFRNIRIRKL